MGKISEYSKLFVWKCKSNNIEIKYDFTKLYIFWLIPLNEIRKEIEYYYLI